MYERYFEKTRFANLFREILAKKGQISAKKVRKSKIKKKIKNCIS